MASKIRVGIVGAGWVVINRHLPGLKGLEDVEVRSIWSRQNEKARKVAAEFGVAGVADRWEQIVESPEIDAVIVATPPIMHSLVTLAALAKGKHVLCQGRMARNLQEAREMLKAARSSQVVTALYPPRGGLKGDRVMRRLLQDEKFVGDIREVRLNSMSFAEEKNEYLWTEDPEVFGVNTMSLGLWTEVLNRWVGPAERVAAFAQTHGKRRKTTAGQWAEAVVPDSLAIAARLECGANATYHYSSRAAAGLGHSVEIYGSRGALMYKFFAEEIQGASDNSAGWQPIPIPPDQERQHSTDREFIQAIRGEGKVSPDFEDGVRYMAFCEAVALAALKGTSVSLPELQPSMLHWGRLLDTRAS